MPAPSKRAAPKTMQEAGLSPQQWATQAAPTVAPTWAATPAVTPAAGGELTPFSFGAMAPNKLQQRMTTPGKNYLPLPAMQYPENADVLTAAYIKTATAAQQAEQALAAHLKTKPKREAGQTAEEAKQYWEDTKSSYEYNLYASQLQAATMVQEQPWVEEASWASNPPTKLGAKAAAQVAQQAKAKYPFMNKGGTFGEAGKKASTLPNIVTLDTGEQIELTAEQAAKRQAAIARQAAGEPSPWELQKLEAEQKQNDASLTFDQQAFAYKQQQDALNRAYQEREWAASQANSAAAGGRAQAALDLQRQQMMQAAWADQMQYGLPAGPTFQPGWQPGGPIQQLSAMGGASYTPQAMIAPQSPLTPQSQVNPDQAAAYLAAAIAKFK